MLFGVIILSVGRGTFPILWCLHLLAFELTHIVGTSHRAFPVVIIVLLLMVLSSTWLVHHILLLLLMMQLLLVHMVLLLIVVERRQFANARPLRTYHLVLLLQLLDLALEFANLDVLQLQLSLQLTHWLFFTSSAAHVVILVRTLG